MDLELASFPYAESEGAAPEWYEFETSQAGEGFFYLPWAVTTAEGWFEGGWKMALDRGISPLQPFLVEIHKPHYYVCSCYADPVEWDVDIEWDIVEVHPWPDEMKARMNECFLRRVQAQRQFLVTERAKGRELQATTAEALYVERSYYKWNCTHDMWSRVGIRLSLKSEIIDSPGGVQLQPTLASFGIKERDMEKAKDGLRKEAVGCVPAATAEVVEEALKNMRWARGKGLP